MSRWDRYLKRKNPIRILAFCDIETGGHNFNGDESHLITWVVRLVDLKTGKSKYYSDRIKKSEIIATNKLLKKKPRLRYAQPYDRRLLINLVKVLKKSNMVIGHYSDYFDVPLVRTRCAMLRIPFIKHTDHIAFGDTWKRARFGMKFIRNGLDQVSKSLGIPITKTRFDRWIWDQGTYYGEKWALDLIMDHNIKDVDILYKVWKLVEENFSIPAKYQ